MHVHKSSMGSIVVHVRTASTLRIPQRVRRKQTNKQTGWTLSWVKTRVCASNWVCMHTYVCSACVGAQRPDYRWRLVLVPRGQTCWRLGLACIGARRPDYRWRLGSRMQGLGLVPVGRGERGGSLSLSLSPLPDVLQTLRHATPCSGNLNRVRFALLYTN
jgi:hypothetical protein